MRRLLTVLGAAAFLLVALGVAAPSSAQADWAPVSTGCPSGVGTPCYVWESPEGVIVEGGKYMSRTEFETLGPETANTLIEGDHLSPAAKTVIESESFPAEAIDGAEAADGVAGASEAEVAVAGLDAIPVLGQAVLAFTAGYGIGTAICNVFGIGGCTDVEADESPPPLSGGHWREGYSEQCGFFQTCHPFGTFFWAPEGFQVAIFSFNGIGGYTTSGLTPPASRDGADLTVEAYEGGKYRAVLWRWMMDGRRVFHSSAPPEGFSSYKYSPPAEWSKQAASNLASGASASGPSANPQVAKVAQFAASKVLGSGVASPYALTVAVPNCDGLLYAACADLIEQAGLHPTHKELGWETAVLEDPAEQVEELSPARSTEVEKGSTVIVTTNPDGPSMPVVIPKPGADETYSQYVAALNPALAPHEVVLGEINENPSYGPNAVTGTNPVAGTRVDPAVTTPVDVTVNPATAPVPAAGGGGACSAGVAAIDWGPLNQPLGDKFPFGIFAFFTGWLGSWEGGSGGPPDWNVTILPAGVFGSPSGLHIHVDLAFMAPIVSVARIAFLFAAFVGLLWFLATAAAKLQGDSS